MQAQRPSSGFANRGKDSLVCYLKGGHSIEEFLQDYPTVERWQIESYLELSLEGLDHLRAQDASAS